MRQEKPGPKSVVYAKKLRYSILPFAKIYTLKIKDLQPDPSLLNEKDKYIAFDTPLDVTVFAVYSSQSKENDVLAKEPIKQILHKQIQKKYSYAIPKNIRFRK